MLIDYNNYKAILVTKFNRVGVNCQKPARRSAEMNEFLKNYIFLPFTTEMIVSLMAAVFKGVFGILSFKIFIIYEKKQTSEKFAS